MAGDTAAMELPVPVVLLGVVLQTLTAAVADLYLTAALVSIYLELRRRMEGTDIEAALRARGGGEP